MKGNIPNHPNYHITKDGRLFSNKSGEWIERKGQVYRGCPSFYFEGKWHRSSRLVAMVYIPNPENKAYVCHKDNNPCNNHIDNLYWGTPSENTQQCIRDGRGYIGDKNPRAKVKNIDREIIRRKFTLGSTINELTKEYNLSRSAIRKILYLSI